MERSRERSREEGGGTIQQLVRKEKEKEESQKEREEKRKREICQSWREGQLGEATELSLQWHGVGPPARAPEGAKEAHEEEVEEGEDDIEFIGEFHVFGRGRPHGAKQSKIQRIAEAAPGLLSSEGLQAMKSHLLQASGTPWEVDDASLPPIVLQYVRQMCHPRASPPVAREMSTLATLSDQVLMGRPAEALDIALQRLKSLEMGLSGHSWVTAQRVELLARTEQGIAGRGEVQVAQKEAQLDAKAKGGASNSEKGQKGKDGGKGKDRGKGKGKTKGGSKEEGKKNQ